MHAHPARDVTIDVLLLLLRVALSLCGVGLGLASSDTLAAKAFTFPPLSDTKPLGWLRAQSRIQTDTLGGHLEYFFVNNSLWMKDYANLSTVPYPQKDLETFRAVLAERHAPAGVPAQRLAPSERVARVHRRHPRPAGAGRLGGPGRAGLQVHDRLPLPVAALPPAHSSGQLR
jgi:hypothetical protein